MELSAEQKLVDRELNVRVTACENEGNRGV